MELTSRPVRRLSGELRAPSDKSLTHRAYMLAAIADGPSVVRLPLEGEDCQSTLACLRSLGLKVEPIDQGYKLHPAPEWRQPEAPLECGNSGTTMRLLSGLVASRPLDVTLQGDPSLSRRPMKRVAEPLRVMGATVEGDKPPLHIVGGDLRGIRYESPVASAQVKSCVLLAGLRASGETSVDEPAKSRDHTERMLRACGVAVDVSGSSVSLRGGQTPRGFEFSVPADPSSAAFFIVAACLVPGSELRLPDLLMNPTRGGILHVLREAGARATWEVAEERLGEPTGVMEVAYGGELRAFKIEGDLVPTLVDEVPVLAVLATQADGVTEIRDASELRVKESDRIERMAVGLRAMGAIVQTLPDGLIIEGPTPLKGAHIVADGDHRIAMAFAIAGLVAEGETVIAGAETIATSFPTFEKELARLCEN